MWFLTCNHTQHPSSNLCAALARADTFNSFSTHLVRQRKMTLVHVVRKSNMMQPFMSLLHIECIGLRSICSNKCVIRAKTLNLAISDKRRGRVRELTGTSGGRIVTELTKGGGVGFEFLLENMGARKWSRRGDGTCSERHVCVESRERPLGWRSECFFRSFL